MHNHGVLGNRPPEGGYARLDTAEWLPVWLQRAGYTRCTSASSSTATARTRRRRRCRRAGASGTRRSTPRPTSSTATCSTRTAWSELPALLDRRVRAAHGGRGDARWPPRPTPSSSRVAFVAPHSGRPARSRRPGGSADPGARPRATATPSRASRCRAGRPSTRPTCPTSRTSSAGGGGSARRAWPPSRRTTARSSSRCSPSTRASWDRRSTARIGRAGAHPDRVHIRQRLLPRRAPRLATAR